MFLECKPGDGRARWTENNRRVFVGGSIEMGKARDWQAIFRESMKGFDVTLLNPRRDDFDAKAAQEITNTYFRSQVLWELESLEMADYIFFHFEPDTKSPITLMELGRFYSSNNVIVSCPPDYWRSGNVDVFCHRYRVPIYYSLEAGIMALKCRLMADGVLVEEEVA